MGKLQRITRKNGSELYNVNVPLEIIENTGWQKGDEISFDMKENNVVQISRE